MHRGRPHDDRYPRDLRRAATLDVARPWTQRCEREQASSAPVEYRGALASGLVPRVQTILRANTYRADVGQPVVVADPLVRRGIQEQGAVTPAWRGSEPSANDRCITDRAPSW